MEPKHEVGNKAMPSKSCRSLHIRYWNFTRCVGFAKTGGSSIKCECLCFDAPSGVPGGYIQSWNTYTIPGGVNAWCDDLIGKTCNQNNPTNGGVATGTLLDCDEKSSTTTSRPPVVLSPFGNGPPAQLQGR